MTAPVANQVYPLANGLTGTGPFITYFSTRNPTSGDVNFVPTQRWFNYVANAEWILVNFTTINSITTANWHPVASISTLETLTGDSGGPVPPTGNNINVLGDPLAPGIVTRGVPGSSTLYVGLMEPTVCGTGQTVGTSTVTLVTIPLGDAAATYSFDAVIAGKAATQSGIGGTAFGTFRTDGTTATIIGTVSVAANFDLVLAGASFTLSASGGSVILTATGSLGTVINWNGCVSYVSVEAGV